MFLNRLLNQGNAPLLERMVQFTATRHTLIAENVVNISTPGYRQKDLSVAKFQELMRERVELRSKSPIGSVSFDDIQGEIEHPRSLLFHDRNNRSMEQLMSEQAKNAMLHNLAVELLRRQYGSMKNALKERVT